MPKILINRTYEDGEALTKADLDLIPNTLETFNNVTKYDNEVLQNGTITTTKLLDSSVNTQILRDSVATTNKFASDVVSTDKIADLAVKSVDIADGAIVESKIASANITKPKISTTDKIPTAKFETRAFQIAPMASSVSIGPTGTSNTTFSTVASMTTSKDMRRFYLQLQGYSSEGIQGAGVRVTATNGSASAILSIAFYLNGVQIAVNQVRYSGNNKLNSDYWTEPQIMVPLSSFKTIYGSNTVIPAGSTVEVKYAYTVAESGNYIDISRANLVLVEL